MNRKTSVEQRDAGWLFKVILVFGVSGSLAAIGLGGLVYWHFSRGLPRIINVADYRPLGVTRVFAKGDAEALEIGEFFKERRYLIPYEKIPEHVVRAFIAAEDDRFFEHPGINIASILRAGIANFKAGHVVQGGSTITQQVAKSLLLSPERSLDRKIKEVILASRIERNLTKQQILYLYLNQIYLGHGAYGVQAASRTFFQKDVSDLNFAEAALLAGMPQAPSKYSPLLNPKRAKERQLYVLRRMFENHFITQSQLNEAAALPLKIYRDEDLNGKYAPYYVEHIRRYLVEKYGEKAVYEDGLNVYLPISPEHALAASRSLKEGLQAVDKRMGYRGPIQHLKDSEEMGKFLEASRIKLIDRKIHFKLFSSDGKIDSIEAMHHAGITADAQLLEPGEIYQAVVTGVDNKKKTIRLMIGAARAEITADRMRWVKPVKDEKVPSLYRPDPLVPSTVAKKGDVVLVSLDTSVSNDKIGLTKDSVIPVTLQQDPVIQGALFSMDVQTGQVLAMVGGYDFQLSEFNRATQAMRQSGSAFKPIIYASALEKGFTPASIIVDSPIVFKDSDGTSTWKPNNYEERFYGDTTFRQALIKSRNIPTVKIVQAVQVPYLIQYARRLGMNGQFNMDLSISLGSASISLLDLTRVYSLFPRLGRKVTPIFLAKAVDRDGRVLEEQVPKPLPTDIVIPAAEASPTASDDSSAGSKFVSKVQFPNYPPENDPDQVLDPRVAYVMTHLMKEVVTYGTGHQAKSLGRPAAGKTGTTNDAVDAWFLGFTPQVVTGVWIGFDSQKSLGVGETGAKAALPVWLSFMREAVKSYQEKDFIIPPGVTFASIDSVSGKLASPNSSSAIKEAFIEGTQHTESNSQDSESSEVPSDFFKEDKE